MGLTPLHTYTYIHRCLRSVQQSPEWGRLEPKLCRAEGIRGVRAEGGALSLEGDGLSECSWAEGEESQIWGSCCLSNSELELGLSVELGGGEYLSGYVWEWEEITSQCTVSHCGVWGQ